MDNFEIYDNAFQTLSLMVMMIVSGAAGLKYSSRKLVVLACAYGSIMLGTLFYMLHLTIIGDIPRIFYVSEISWMAGYLFSCSSSHCGMNGKRRPFSRFRQCWRWALWRPRYTAR